MTGYKVIKNHVVEVEKSKYKNLELVKKNHIKKINDKIKKREIEIKKFKQEIEQFKNNDIIKEVFVDDGYKKKLRARLTESNGNDIYFITPDGEKGHTFNCYIFFREEGANS